MSPATQKFDFFPVLFVAVSHCDKELFFFVALIHCDKQSLYLFRKNSLKRAQQCYFLYFLLFLEHFFTFWHFVCPFLYFFSKNSTHFGILCAIYTNFFCRSDSVRQTENQFVAVTQCDKQNKSLSQ